MLSVLEHKPERGPPTPGRCFGVLRGFRPEQLRDLVADSMERVLRPLVYAQSLDLVERHRRRGEPVYIVSATLQEIVQAIADDLSFDGALGTVCEVSDGVYTGRAVRPLHAENKARCIQELGYELDESTAYSDSHTDLPFLEAVGHPVAVNPDRALRRIAASAAGRCWSSDAVQRDEALSRLRALGFDAAKALALWEHFDEAEQHGKLGHGHSRIPWLEESTDYDPGCRATARPGRRRLSALARERRTRVPHARRRRRAPDRHGRRRTLASSCASRRSRPGCSGSTCAGSRSPASSGC